MKTYPLITALVVTAFGLLLLIMDLAGCHIGTRGVDSIAGAILIGAGILALPRKPE